MSTDMIAPLVLGFLLAILFMCIALLAMMVHTTKKHEREKEEKVARIAAKKASKAKARGELATETGTCEVTASTPEKIVTEDGKKLTLAQREALRRQKK